MYRGHISYCCNVGLYLVCFEFYLGKQCIAAATRVGEFRVRVRVRIILELGFRVRIILGSGLALF